jgi:hypothetical protein
LLKRLKTDSWLYEHGYILGDLFESTRESLCRLLFLQEFDPENIKILVDQQFLHKVSNDACLTQVSMRLTRRNINKNTVSSFTYDEFCVWLHQLLPVICVNIFSKMLYNCKNDSNVMTYIVNIMTYWLMLSLKDTAYLFYVLQYWVSDNYDKQVLSLPYMTSMFKDVKHDDLLKCNFKKKPRHDVAPRDKIMLNNQTCIICDYGSCFPINVIPLSCLSLSCKTRSCFMCDRVRTLVKEYVCCANHHNLNDHTINVRDDSVELGQIYNDCFDESDGFKQPSDNDCSEPLLFNYKSNLLAVDEQNVKTKPKRIFSSKQYKNSRKIPLISSNIDCTHDSNECDHDDNDL